MTAVRWWVKAYARWIARIQSVQGQLNLLFTAMSGVGIASGALKYLGAPTWMIAAFLGVLFLCIVVYTWSYSEGGVWNQKQRDQHDMSANFAPPAFRIDDVLIGVAMFAAQEGRPPDQGEFEAIDEAVDTYWREFRDGVEIHD